MKRAKPHLGRLKVSLVLFLVMIILTSGCSLGKGRPVASESSPVPLLLAMEKRFTPEEVTFTTTEVNPQIPEYALPLRLEDISNWEEAAGKIDLTSEQKDLLSENGFLVVDTPSEIGEKEYHLVYLSYPEGSAKAKEDFTAFYAAIGEKDLPVFVTSDSFLHFFHLFFEVTLIRFEENLFYPYLWDILKYLQEESLSNFQNLSSPDLKEASKRNLAYLSVALELLKPKESQRVGFSEEELSQFIFQAPSVVKDLVDEELSLISEHSGWSNSPIFIYEEDYSQYVPRGHYLESEKLKNYFLAYMYLGRMTALIQGSEEIPRGKADPSPDLEGIISTHDAKIQTLQACLISFNLMKSEDIQEKWSKIYSITSFLVGYSDDLGPLEYSTLIRKILGERANIEAIEEKFEEIQQALKDLPYSPRIYSGLGNLQVQFPSPPLTEEKMKALQTQMEKVSEKTKGFRFLGQKFTLDSWAFSKLVFPYSGEYTGEKRPLPTEDSPFSFTWNDPYTPDQETRPFSWIKTITGYEARGFPLGLDIMALLGSERSTEIIRERGDDQYSGYQKAFEGLKPEFVSFEQDPPSIYLNWLQNLRLLLSPFPEGYPTFMRTKSWQDKELNTSLSSWTELRHDTNLYVKQSYVVAERSGPEPQIPPFPGYVEPVPDLYQKMLNLAELTKAGLNEILSPEEQEKVDLGLLDSLIYRSEWLLNIAKKELENQPLSVRDYEAIKNYWDGLAEMIKYGLRGEVYPDLFKSTLVVDVNTEGNTKLVLEEATGYLRTMLVAYRLPDNRIILGVGPVFSYYEFKQPMASRLTDEEWRNMLEGVHPDQPAWQESFSK